MDVTYGFDNKERVAAMLMDNGGTITDRLIAQAGIEQGAKALDFGCGGGDVTFRLAKAVGHSGEVLGIDLNSAALQVARQTAENDGVSNVSFAEHDIRIFAEQGETFDVIMCRRVLMYLPQQIETTKALIKLLNPDGVFIVQEHDASIMHASTSLPLHRQARSWIWSTVQSEGANINTGFELHQILSAAGCSRITISAEAVVETPTQAGLTADILKVMLPRIEAAGVATAREIDVETLEQRLAEERRSSGATVIGEMVFGAIARP
ncbi:class I SAM-dependent methyltransferase [Aliiroseovarius sp. YM-037]|uniref:class I SAM-dependent methyltransferase n=1 Tax=Aliiroseovarius sp. YM-037 TaxID=3341728 RepID=UPI003A804AF7